MLRKIKNKINDVRAVIETKKVLINAMKMGNKGQRGMSTSSDTMIKVVVALAIAVELFVVFVPGWLANLSNSTLFTGIGGRLITTLGPILLGIGVLMFLLKNSGVTR